MSNGQNGKGDAPRPFSVDRTTYINNWERAFGKKTIEESTCAYSGLLSASSYDSQSLDTANKLTQEMGL